MANVVAISGSSSLKEQRWRTAGSMGHVAAFSFYPGKNLGACGEAGAITTDDARIAQQCRMLRKHGQSKKYYHDMVGYNGRLDAIRAGFLRVKLRHLKNWTAQNRTAARRATNRYSVHGLSCRATHALVVTAVYRLHIVRIPIVNGSRRSAGRVMAWSHYPSPTTPLSSTIHDRSDFPATVDATTMSTWCGSRVA